MPSAGLWLKRESWAAWNLLSSYPGQATCPHPVPGFVMPTTQAPSKAADSVLAGGQAHASEKGKLGGLFSLWPKPAVQSECLKPQHNKNQTFTPLSVPHTQETTTAATRSCSFRRLCRSSRTLPGIGECETMAYWRFMDVNGSSSLSRCSLACRPVGAAHAAARGVCAAMWPGKSLSIRA